MRPTFSSFLAASMLAVLGACAAPAETTGTSGSSADTEIVASIDVKPILTIGSGKAGSGDEDVNAPDGVIFDGAGNVVLTDANNHRVQVWSVAEKRKLGQFGTSEIFRGEIVDLAMNPKTGQIIVTDEDTHVAYPFDPPGATAEGDHKFTDYTFRGDMFAGEKVVKVGGITFDSKGRIYTVDARQNLVRRYESDGTPDPTFQFAEKGSVPYLNGCEGIAIDDKRGNIYVASEFDSVIQVFDLEDGSYKKQMIGARPNPDQVGKRLGSSIFPAAIEGLWILDDYLLASDEADGNGEGHVVVFDLSDESVFNTGPEDWAKKTEAGERAPYLGAFGHFSSPDSVAAYTDKDGKSVIAVADQGHYQVVVYDWADIVKAGKFARSAK